MDCDRQKIKLFGIVVLFSNFFWENWTFFVPFLEKNVVLAGYFCSLMYIIISGEIYH